MKVSFLVTYYNQEAYVRKSLDSLLDIEKPEEWEILVGDDGSSDDTVNVVMEYIRKYPDCIKVKKWLCLLTYVGCAAGSVALGLLVLFVDSKVGKLGGYAGNFFPYNSTFTLIGSIALFLFFLQLNIKEGVFGKILVRLGACTFGVFLIHEHMYMRYLWPTWFKVAEMKDSPWLLLHLAGTVLTVFLVCSLIDMVRQFIFKYLFNNKCMDALLKPFAKLEESINGGEK